MREVGFEVWKDKRAQNHDVGESVDFAGPTPVKMEGRNGGSL
jgi:hypothetical protein